MLARYDLPPHRVVIELIENEIAEAMRYYATLGCLLAIDDFGAGPSNFDRIWRIQPQIVKIARASLVQARNCKRIRRVLPQPGFSVARRHRGRGRCDDRARFRSRFCARLLFWPPATQLLEQSTCASSFDDLCNRHAQGMQTARRISLRELNPYIKAFRGCGELAAANWNATEASLRMRMLTMSNVPRCYLLDKNGHQLAAISPLPNRASQADKRFLPMANGKEAV